MFSLNSHFVTCSAVMRLTRHDISYKGREVLSQNKSQRTQSNWDSYINIEYVSPEVLIDLHVVSFSACDKTSRSVSPTTKANPGAIICGFLHFLLRVQLWRTTSAIIFSMAWETLSGSRRIRGKSSRPTQGMVKLIGGFSRGHSR